MQVRGLVRGAQVAENLFGGFGVEVLAAALAPFGIELVNARRGEERAVVESPEHGAVAVLYEALLVRPARAHHWFALRRIAGHWFRMDSQADQPVPLSQPQMVASSRHYWRRARASMLQEAPRLSKLQQRALENPCSATSTSSRGGMSYRT